MSQLATVSNALSTNECGQCKWLVVEICDTHGSICGSPPCFQLLIARESCPRYYEAEEEALQFPEVRQAMEDDAPLLKELAQYAGMEFNTPHDVQWIENIFEVEEENHLKLPEWTKRVFPHFLDDLVRLTFKLLTYTFELKQIRGGVFVELVLTVFAAIRDGTLTPKEQKLSLYCAHDYTLINILNTFGIRGEYDISYGTMVLFELILDEDTGEIGVEIYLRNNATIGATPLTIPGCTHFCPLDRFTELNKKYVAANRTQLCQTRDPDYVPPPSTEQIFRL